MIPKESPKLRVTKDYSLFVHSEDNREVHLEGRKGLFESMKEHGFIPAYPLLVRHKGTKLEIIDGQHRLATAQKLGLNVWYIVLDLNVDVASLNATQKPWKTRDYAECYAEQGNAHYRELLDFSDSYGIPIMLAAAILSSKSEMNGGNRARYVSGEFIVTSRKDAGIIAGIYSHLSNISKNARSGRLLEALVACARTSAFDATRLKDNASRCPEKIVAYSTREAWLQCLEEIYNYGRMKREPLKVNALNAMRTTNPAIRKELVINN